MQNLKSHRKLKLKRTLSFKAWEQQHAIRYYATNDYATMVLLQPAFYFLYYVTTSSRTVVSKIYLIKRASHAI